MAEGLIVACWTADATLSTKMNQRVAHYTGQLELNTYTQEGLAALAAGRKDEATVKLRRAAELAEASGREDTVRMIRKVMTGMRRDMSGLDAEMASVKSRKTVQWRKKDDSVS